jgi:hypothetical protein
MPRFSKGGGGFSVVPDSERTPARQSLAEAINAARHADSLAKAARQGVENARQQTLSSAEAELRTAVEGVAEAKASGVRSASLAAASGNVSAIPIALREARLIEADARDCADIARASLAELELATAAADEAAAKAWQVAKQRVDDVIKSSSAGPLLAAAQSARDALAARRGAIAFLADNGLLGDELESRAARNFLFSTQGRSDPWHRPAPEPIADAVADQWREARERLASDADFALPD